MTDTIQVLIHGQWVEKPLTKRARELLDKAVGGMGSECTWCQDEDGYICTREAGHRGPHIAHSTDALAVWKRS